jgi:two-component system sensor histidine kinase UhpB
VLILSPGSLSEPVALRELGIFAAALFVMVLANLIVTQRLVAPLEQLVRVMREVDLLKPGSRVSVGGAPSEATELAETFNAMLDRLEAEREESMRRVIGAQEAERLRIAQELHDQVGQDLTAVLLALARAQSDAQGKLGSALAEAQQAIRASLEDVRRIALELRPEALDDLGLPSALAVLCERFSERSGLAVCPRIAETLPALSDEAELVIYRVAQEALTNVARHSGSERAELTLGARDGQLTLAVRDWGRGLAPGAGPGSGIRGMHERAALIGAQVEIRDRPPGGGCELRLDVPLQEAR